MATHRTAGCGVILLFFFCVLWSEFTSSVKDTEEAPELPAPAPPAPSQELNAATTLSAQAEKIERRPENVATASAKLQVPTFMYGTAWKREQTADLTFQAIRLGFYAIDTANQQKHYKETGVGEALQRAYKDLGKQRSDFFVQTKYSHGQWKKSTLSYTEQVNKSVEQSLKHLQTDYLDCLLLHGPLNKRSPTLPDGGMYARLIITTSHVHAISWPYFNNFHVHAISTKTWRYGEPWRRYT